MSVMQSIFGLFVFCSCAFLISRDRRNISFKFVAIGLTLQFFIAFLLLRVPPVANIFLYLNKIVSNLQNATNQASQFMFGYIAGGPAPFVVSNPANSFIVAFQVLPLILVVGAISALLFHFGILTWIVNLLARGLQKVFPLSGALGFGAASTVFLGTIEAPLIIRPYLERLKPAEFLSLLVCSMSTIAGTVIVLYASVLEQTVPGALAHLLVASLISVPAALTLAHIFMPSAEERSTIMLEKSESTWVEAILDSIQDGINMIISIVAIIIVLFAFINLLNGMLQTFDSTWSINAFFGFLLRPVMWLVGFTWESAGPAAELMGTKIVLNEFVSYLELAKVQVFSPKETLLAVYALCGFANFASCGIIVAGLSALVPKRRKEIVRHTFWALLFGNLTTLMTACVFNIVSIASL